MSRVGKAYPLSYRPTSPKTFSSTLTVACSLATKQALPCTVVKLDLPGQAVTSTITMQEKNLSHLSFSFVWQYPATNYHNTEHYSHLWWKLISSSNSLWDSRNRWAEGLFHGKQYEKYKQRRAMGVLEQLVLQACYRNKGRLTQKRSLSARTGQ